MAQHLWIAPVFLPVNVIKNDDGFKVTLPEVVRYDHMELAPFKVQDVVCIFCRGEMEVVFGTSCDNREEAEKLFFSPFDN